MAAGALVLLVAVGAVLVATTATPRAVRAIGVGGATWTPATSTTTTTPSRFLVEDDSITYETAATWTREQSRGLQRYVDDGLRFTHEVNDRSGRLSATGYWATNHPDPAFDRDDDDDDWRWEEAEITAGTEAPLAGREYQSLIQFSRWRGREKRDRCEWAWDRRLGSIDVLSQLSRDLLGEWQAERFTRTFAHLEYPRVGLMPELPASSTPAECSARGPLDASHAGVVVTLKAPIAWNDFLVLPEGAGRWTAFEAIGKSERARGTWTCGGPVYARIGLRPCRSMDVRPEGVVAAVGYFDDDTINALRQHPDVARVDGLRDPITGFFSDIGGFGVQPPDLTVNDAYWELFLAS